MTFNLYIFPQLFVHFYHTYNGCIFHIFNIFNSHIISFVYFVFILSSSFNKSSVNNSPIMNYYISHLNIDTH